MSTYTIELRKICDIYGQNEVENWFKDFDNKSYLTTKQLEVINTSGLWSKDKLAHKIIEHYYMREIGFETPALFKHYAKVTMQEIMEEKLPKIYSACLDYDPLINVDFTETFNRKEIQKNNGSNTNTSSSNSSANSNGTDTQESSGISNSTSNSNSSNFTINSDTPQSRISKEQIFRGDYASTTSGNEAQTSVTDNTSNSTNASNNSSTSTSSETNNDFNGSFNNNLDNLEEYTKHQIRKFGCFNYFSKINSTV